MQESEKTVDSKWDHSCVCRSLRGSKLWNTDKIKILNMELMANDEKIKEKEKELKAKEERLRRLETKVMAML